MRRQEGVMGVRRWEGEGVKMRENGGEVEVVERVREVGETKDEGEMRWCV